MLCWHPVIFLGIVCKRFHFLIIILIVKNYKNYFNCYHCDAIFCPVILIPKEKHHTHSQIEKHVVNSLGPKYLDLNSPNLP